MWIALVVSQALLGSVQRSAGMQVPKSEMHPQWQSEDIEIFELTLPQLGA